MSRSATEPAGIKKIGSSQIAITWGDNHASQYEAAYLRGRCPCASCVDEWTGHRRISPEAFASDLAVDKAEIVGRYALHFTFSDSHDTGIYTFDYLRKLCPCEQCQARPV